MSDEMKDLADSERELSKAEAQFERFMRRKCDWDDPDDVNLYRRSIRAEDRRAILDRLVPDRRCPSCRTVVVNSRSWVINKRRTKVRCRSCWSIMFLEPKLEEEGRLKRIRVKQAIARAGGDEPRFTFNGVALETAIQMADMTKAHFSRRAGWSASYTQKLVNGRVRSVNADTAKVILTVLAEGGVELEMEQTDYDAIFGSSPTE